AIVDGCQRRSIDGAICEWVAGKGAGLVLPNCDLSGRHGRNTAADNFARREGMNEKHLDIVRRVLDHQLLDSNYIECGKVEDVELTSGAGELAVTAIITGPGAAAERLPGWLRSLWRRLMGASEKRLPWAEVLIITSQIKLRSRATELGLAEVER